MQFSQLFLPLSCGLPFILFTFSQVPYLLLLSHITHVFHFLLVLNKSRIRVLYFCKYSGLCATFWHVLISHSHVITDQTQNYRRWFSLGKVEFDLKTAIICLNVPHPNFNFNLIYFSLLLDVSIICSKYK